MNYLLHKRKSPNWLEIADKDKFLDQEFEFNKGFWRVHLLKMWPLIEMWQNHLNISYFEYRHELKEISNRNLNKTKYSHLIKNNEELSLHNDYILICVDDDDWYHPDIFSILEKNFNNFDDLDLFIWNETTQDFKHGFLHYSQHTILTNNYALTKRGVEKILNESTSQLKFNGRSPTNNPLNAHYDLDKRIFRSGEDFKIAYLNNMGVLSLYNKTLASTMFMKHVLNHDKNFKKFLKRMPNYKWKTDSLTEIFKEEVEELNLLHEKIIYKE